MHFAPAPSWNPSEPRRLPSRPQRALQVTQAPLFQLVANMLIAAAFSGLPLQERGIYLSRQPPARTTRTLVGRLGTPPTQRKSFRSLN